MSISHTETLGENVELPTKYAEFNELIEHLGQLREKANELAAQQIDLTGQIETAFKKARDLHQKMLEDQTDVRGKG
jgi:hypothetical protein